MSYGKRPRKTMTKAEAVKDFNATIKPAVIARYGRKDRPAIREAWVMYVDGLERDGMITGRQAMTWDNPF